MGLGFSRKKVPMRSPAYGSSYKTKSKGKRFKRATSVVLATLIAFGAHKGLQRTARITDPDFIARQKFWSLSSKSVRVYKEVPIPENLIGSSKYRLGKSLARAGLVTYDIHINGKEVGLVKANFKILGKKYTLELGEVDQNIQRPFQLYRKKWTMSKNGEPRFLIHETNKSFWVPGLHHFEIMDAVSGKTIAHLGAQWHMRRFLLGRRDYAIRFEEGHEGAMSHAEITGLLTTIGKVSKSGGGNSSKSKKGK